MKKALLLLAILLLVPCTSFAGHWIRTGEFDPGMYVVCTVYGGMPLSCDLVSAVGGAEEAQSNVDAMNESAEILSQLDIIWYHWDNGYWIKYKCPWRYIEGEVM